MQGWEPYRESAGEPTATQGSARSALVSNRSPGKPWLSLEGEGALGNPGEPWRTQGSPGEPREALVNPGEAQGSFGQP